MKRCATVIIWNVLNDRYWCTIRWPGLHAGVEKTWCDMVPVTEDHLLGLATSLTWKAPCLRPFSSCPSLYLNTATCLLCSFVHAPSLLGPISISIPALVWLTSICPQASGWASVPPGSPFWLPYSRLGAPLRCSLGFLLFQHLLQGKVTVSRFTGLLNESVCVSYDGSPSVRVWYTAGVQHILNGMDGWRDCEPYNALLAGLPLWNLSPSCSMLHPRSH